ncbi:hypothetical protein [Rhizobium sp. Leaf262]|uniref:hypothetical protein n=1 Tax=Rhizobium sp. Leaf262 TaxID=1736312 RepID=UPI000B22DFEE|nr:hypothetical protein [Rhizobium sp. Leaf262]
MEQKNEKIIEAILSEFDGDIRTRVFEIEGQLCRVVYVGHPYIFDVRPLEPIKVEVA